MNLYEVDFDGDVRVVVADTMTAAIRKWAAALLVEFGPNSGWTLDDEPTTVRRITDADVIR